jgi:hypothetical protein
MRSIRVYIDQQKYIDLGLRPLSIYFCLVDITTSEVDIILLVDINHVSTSYKSYYCIIYDIYI